MAAFVAVAICAAAHAAAGVIFFGIFGVGWSGLVLLTLWGARSVIGRSQVTAGPDGIWAPAFQLPWEQIRALDFVSGGTSYGKIDPHQTHAARRRETSLVVTSRAANKNGRPLQYGTTLHQFNSENFDEFRSAVRALAPHVEFWTTLNVSDYVVDPTAQQELARQFAATGRVAVTTRRGKEKMYFDRNGVGADDKFVPWTAGHRCHRGDRPVHDQRQNGKELRADPEARDRHEYGRTRRPRSASMVAMSITERGAAPHLS
ncbi:hypothetical protein [Gordonia sp. N1V]|uniref:hypothetical protein n=1 Tax=Gordonia sp. N1V TaxID=3034163 RepID=UPI0023E14EC7|nr:hypothetical protein [Gordonia sp. N1V]MDF3283696.1 hypothetical protein [Gordonia sp. N1V]